MQSSRIGRAARPVRDVLDEIEERRLAPVDVVEDEDQRALAGRGLEEPPDRPEGLLARARASADAHSCDTRLHTRSWCSSPVQHASRPWPRRLGQVEVGEARRLLDDLDDREVRDALAVGKASAAEDLGAAAETGDELLDQTGLADARRPEDREQLTRASPSAASKACRSWASWRSRPTIGESRARGTAETHLAARRAAATPATRSALPFSSSGSTGSASTASRTSR